LTAGPRRSVGWSTSSTPTTGCARRAAPQYPILFVLPSRIREQNLHRRLADRPEPALAVATTCPEAGDDSAGPVQWLAGNDRHRRALADLPSHHGEPAPLAPGPAHPDEHPLGFLPADPADAA
jgi:hypothetical protein